MIITFPNLNTLEQCLRTGAIPEEIVVAPVKYLFENEIVLVEPSSWSRAKNVTDALADLGVVANAGKLSSSAAQHPNWLHLVPLKKNPKADSQPLKEIIFQLAPTESTAIVQELLRLGNDRISYWQTSVGENNYVYLRVIEPPYYTVLRAIDAPPTQSVRAYLPQKTGIWVQYGYRHPFADQLVAPESEEILISSTGDWFRIFPQQFADIYQILDIRIANSSTTWTPQTWDEPIQVPLKLVAGNAADSSELHVIENDAIDQLDAFVREATHGILEQFSFAVIEQNPTTWVVIRARNQKATKIPLQFKHAHQYKPFWKIPNLFIPTAKRILPQLRRETVRQLLAPNPEQIIWLREETDGDFIPNSLPDKAFRPLSEWVDYIIHHDRVALAHWLGAAEFRFDKYICDEDDPINPSRKKNQPMEKPKQPPPQNNLEAFGSRKKLSYTHKPIQTENVGTIDLATPSVDLLREELLQLEQEFRELTCSIDDPIRTNMWVKMAGLHHAMQDELGCRQCWMQAFWWTPEAISEHREDYFQHLAGMRASHFTQEALKKTLDTRATSTLLATIVYYFSNQSPPQWVWQLLGELGQAILALEPHLGIKEAWISQWLLAHGHPDQIDTLSIVRTRDRILSRLLENGLNIERDFPRLYRFNNNEESQRQRTIISRISELFSRIEQWHEAEDTHANYPYLQYSLAFTEFYLSEENAAIHRLQKTKEYLEHAPNHSEPVHQWFQEAFQYRIQQAREKRPHRGNFSEAINAKAQANSSDSMFEFTIKRFCEVSWVLMPDESLDAYSKQLAVGSPLYNSLLPLGTMRDGEKLAAAWSAIWLAPVNNTPHARLTILKIGLQYASRAGLDFVHQLLHYVPETTANARNNRASISNYDPEADRWQIYHLSMVLANNYELHDWEQSLLKMLVDEARALTGNSLADNVMKLVKSGMGTRHRKSLFKKLDQFFAEVTAKICRNAPFSRLSETVGSDWLVALAALLRIKQAQLQYDPGELPKELFELAMSVVVQSPAENAALHSKHYLDVLTAFIGAIGQLPAQQSIELLNQLFQKLPKLPNRFSTNKYFSRVHVVIVEEVLRALVNDQFTLGEATQQMLNEEEALVRKRIHRDMHSILR
ncbi:MAG: hypothetical protein R3B84_08750 [Zavarzinella sp.]